MNKQQTIQNIIDDLHKWNFWNIEKSKKNKDLYMVRIIEQANDLLHIDKVAGDDLINDILQFQQGNKLIRDIQNKWEKAGN